MTFEKALLLGSALALFFAFGLACGYFLWAPKPNERRSLKRANRIAENLAYRAKPYPSRLSPDDAGYIASIDN